MKSFKDCSANFDNFRQNEKHQIFKKLKTKIIELGGVVNDEIWPTSQEIDEAASSHSHKLFEKYYGTADFMEVYNTVEDDNKDFHLSEDDKVFVQNWKSARKRQMSMNEMAELPEWGDDYDPVSRLIICADVATRVDNACFNYHNEDRVWLLHNAKYYSKIGFTSQYYPQVMRQAEKGYEKTKTIIWSDKTIEYVARAAVELQKSLADIKIKRMNLEDVNEEALSKNNKAAESAPGFRNQKHPEVRAEVLEDAHFIYDNCDYRDVQLINEQRRIQSGGNVLFDTYYPLELDTAGHIVFDKEAVKVAIYQIASERGYSTILAEHEPKVLAGLESLVTYEKIPSNEDNRKALVEERNDDNYLKKNYDGSWRYNYWLTFPNVFVQVKDKYPELGDVGDKIYTKHRSVKASMGAHNKNGQAFVYPLMEAWKAKHLVIGDPYYSLVVQWSHPDDLKAYFTEMMMVNLPEKYGKFLDELYIPRDKISDFKKILDDNGLYTINSADDKSGFDMYNHPCLLYLFYCAFFSIPFVLSDDDKRILKYLIVNDVVCFVSGVDCIYLYTDLISSGMFDTSLRGTYSSNIMSLVARQLSVDHDNHEFDQAETEKINNNEESSTDEKDDNQTEEEDL